MVPTEFSLANGTGEKDRIRPSLIVPLEIESRCSVEAIQPIAVGVPFPKGALLDTDGLTLFDADDRRVPVQVQALARWSDGSVRWLLVELLSNLQGEKTARFTLRQETHAQGAPASSLRVAESPESFVVDTGVACFHLDRRILRPFTRVLLDGRDVLGGEGASCLLTDAKDKAGQPRIERSTVETQGPLRTTIRFDGAWNHRPAVRFTARLSFSAGTGLVQFRLTVHNPKRARHPGGLWDLGDAGSMCFRDLSLALSLPESARSRIFYATEVGQALQLAGSADLEIYQDSSGGENWQSRNHVNRNGQVPCSFRGYRVRRGTEEISGLRASPLVSITGTNGCVTAAVPEFWQQFPKALEVRDGRLCIGLFPRQFGDVFELQGGEQKTHTVWLHFGSPSPSPGGVLDWVHSPASVRLEPEWYAQTGVVPHLAPAEAPGEDRLDVYLQDAVQGEKSLFARREIIDEYGWRNYGEVYADHEAAYHNGPTPLISHYNNQYDQVYGALLQYWRSGDRRWLELADPLARHVIDIDIYHTDEDRAVYNGGMFWFTDHYKDAATSTHRTYSRANCRPGDRSYGGGPGSCHNFATGLLHYYYQTGDPLARGAVLSLADWVVGMDDGRLNILGLIDDGPTGVVSATAELEYHGPGRGGGLSIYALLDGWLVSGQRGYLDKAEELIRRCVHPADDIAARELLDVERRWSYTIFFAALARYLDIKAEAEELDFMYAYAQASLIHYAVWMLENEKPYFDQRDKLEYPTEAWPAQELRKANVLRLAAAHTDEPMRSRLLRRGMELADRAWEDLLRFETRSSARAIAIVLVEGTRDSYFRTQSVKPAPVAPRRFDFGTPTVFVPQKLRVRAQLRTLSGMGRALVRLASPGRWWRLARRRP